MPSVKMATELTIEACQEFGRYATQLLSHVSSHDLALMANSSFRGALSCKYCQEKVGDIVQQLTQTYSLRQRASSSGSIGQ